MKSLALVLLLAASASAQTSPDNSRVPPLTSVTDSAGGIFTLMAGSGARTVLRNGTTTYGAGVALLLWKGVAYVNDGGGGWYRYIGGVGFPWVRIGTDPSGGPAVVLPPVIVPSALNKLAWTMSGTTNVIVAGGSFKLYVDALAGVVVAGRACVVAGVDVSCSVPLPTLSLGPHTLALTWIDAKGVESVKSIAITILLSATMVPSGLRLE